MSSFLDDLQHKNLIWRGVDQQPSGITQGIIQGSGFAELDAHLQGGLPQQGVVEIESPVGIGELRLLLPFFSHRRNRSRLIVFVAPPGIVDAELLAQVGIAPSRVILLEPAESRDALWSAEQCLKSGACCAALFWHATPSVPQIKRLQLAAERGRCVHFIFTEQRRDGVSLPVSLSLQLEPHPQGVQVTIRKRRGGWSPRPFIVDMSHAWPDLVKQPLPDNIIPFPQKRAQANGSV